jgi:ABC-type amino acid transport substrate-binding protein
LLLIAQMPPLVSILLAIALLVPWSVSGAALALDPADAAWLRERGPLVLAFSEIPPFALLRDGRPTGYSVAMLERAAAALGIGIELRQMSTEAGLAAVRSGAVDGLLNVAVTEARSVYLRYGKLTVPMEPRIFAHRYGPPLAELADLSGRRVAVWPAGLTAALIEGLDPPALPVPVADQREAVRAVAEGAADATSWTCATAAGCSPRR